MALVIRMKRTGRKNRPSYRISVSERSYPRDGRTLESLGFYDPASPKPELRLKLDVERARHWVGHGATPSPTVHSIFKRNGVYEGLPVPEKKQAKTGKRNGRGKVTATKTRRIERKKVTAERKQARRKERLAHKRAAAKAAKAETPAS
jgi:small subunit ribosomal protein S16